MNEDPRIGEAVLVYATPRPAQPFWVKVGLWGLPNRASVWVCCWLSVAIAGFSVVRGLKSPIWYLGALMLLAALWYWASIRWVDKHGGWSQVRG